MMGMRLRGQCIVNATPYPFLVDVEATMAWTERFDYLPIVDRKPLKLPDGARVAVWVIVNIEEWDIHQPHGAHHLTAARWRYQSTPRRAQL